MRQGSAPRSWADARQRPGRLVERVPDPNDGRSVQVVLSTTGRGRVDDALTDLLAHERAILATLSASDQDQLADLLRGLTLPFDTAAD